MMSKQRVVVAMSGGVDSSVAAALLVQQGYDVIGLMMRLWSEPGCESESDSGHNRCCTPDALIQARTVAAQLDIPFYVVDTQTVFKQRIVEFFLDGYAAGVTPNPCLECNRHIRWDFLLNKALSLGATHLATGHYAQVQQTPTGQYHLLRGVDALKDQSYVLSVLNQSHLQHAYFPIGGYPKAQVRELAAQFQLPVAQRKDSQDLCFLADSNYRRFVREYRPQTEQPGDIVTRSGQVLGQHDGLANYTIGQRKGIGIAQAHPLYVIGKQAATNTLLVGELSELGSQQCRVTRFNWVCAPDPAPTAPFEALVQIRYKAQAVPATVTPTAADTVEVSFAQPMRDVTPGQAAVVYLENRCLGGGVIAPC
jgi:tRNA-specific 2-thiouridylase